MTILQQHFYAKTLYSVIQFFITVFYSRRILFWALPFLLWLAFDASLEAAVSRTRNFVVTTQDAELAELFAQTAEKQRQELAISWLGTELPDWASPCKIKVKVGPTLSPGGATTFVFSNGQVFGWDMNIQGSTERVIDSVLPHEITHMIFACKFRQPVPRWADEGAATSVEHTSERNKYRRMLIGFLQTNRGIAFRTMVNADEYPPDAMPFYAQSYTAAEYLIARGGRKRYVAFVENGINNNDWSGALRKYYGYPNLGEFQNVWVNWVGRGYPAVENDLLQRDLLAANQNGNGRAAAQGTLAADSARTPAYNSYANNNTSANNMANRNTYPNSNSYPNPNPNQNPSGAAGYNSYADAGSGSGLNPPGYNGSGYTNVQVSRPEPNLIIRTPVSTAHPRSVTDAISGSYNNSYNNDSRFNNDSGSYNGASTAVPMNNQTGNYQGAGSPNGYQGGYQEAVPLSYNATAPQNQKTSPTIVQTSAVEAPSQSAKTLRWLPASTQALYEEPVENRSAAGVIYDASSANSLQR